MKKLSKAISLILALIMILILAAGCNGNETPASPSAPQNQATPQTSATPSEEGSQEITYPLADGATFTCWWPNDLALSGVQDYNETPIFQYLEKKTGVHLEFQNPAAQGAAEQYNLILAGGDLPDFFRQLYLYHVRGMEDAVDSGWILDQMKYIEYTPNLLMRLNENTEFFRQAITDTGYLTGFPMIMNEAAGFVNGMMVRLDWLEKYNLTRPQTLSELENVLTVFKENEASTANGPLWMNSVCFTGLEGAFEMPSDYGMPGHDQFVIKNGEVKAAALEPGFKDYVELMADWYSKGLISTDFVNHVGYIAIVDEMGGGRQNGKYGVTFDCFVYMDQQNELGKAVDPNINFAPMSIPMQTAGEILHTLGTDRFAWQGALGITTQCEDVELACRYWDYLYSEEGSIYANFGEEGVTLEYKEDGLPHLSDFAKNHPEGMNLNQVENYYTLLDGPFYRIGYREYDAISDNELTCGDYWGASATRDSAYSMPSTITLTAEEGTLRSNLMSDISTFIVENKAKFITGVRPMSEFDSFVEEIRAMGIEQICDMYEGALERYDGRLDIVAQYK